VRDAKDKDGRERAAIFVQLPDRDELPSYYEVIDHPMDLRMVREKMDEGPRPPRRPIRQLTDESAFRHRCVNAWYGWRESARSCSSVLLVGAADGARLRLPTMSAVADAASEGNYGKVERLLKNGGNANAKRDHARRLRLSNAPRRRATWKSRGCSWSTAPTWMLAM